MDVREKLAEIERAAEWFEKRTKNTPMPVARKMFELAGESLREKAHGATIPEWISVKDRLPEDFEFIIVANWDENHTPRVVKRKALMAREYWGIVTGFYAHGQQVTHWMPLPQPPKGE